MATHSSILAWKILRTEEPDGSATVHWVTESDTTEHAWSMLVLSLLEMPFSFQLSFQTPLSQQLRLELRTSSLQSFLFPTIEPASLPHEQFLIHSRLKCCKWCG